MEKTHWGGFNWFYTCLIGVKLDLALCANPGFFNLIQFDCEALNVSYFRPFLIFPSRQFAMLLRPLHREKNTFQVFYFKNYNSFCWKKLRACTEADDNNQSSRTKPRRNGYNNANIKWVHRGISLYSWIRIVQLVLTLIDWTKNEDEIWFK